eukprot:Gb_10790 [translate_table: standard]
MALIDVVRKATVDNKGLDFSTKCSITLNANLIVRSLIPIGRQIDETTRGEPEEAGGAALIRRVSGWKITDTDDLLIQEETQLVRDLKNRLKTPKEFTPEGFLALLKPFLHKLQDQVGVSHGDLESTDEASVLNSLGPYLGRDLVNIITHCCVTLAFWKPLESLIPHGLLSWNSCGDLMQKLAESRRGDILCLCVKHMHDIRPSDLLLIIRYFLDTPFDRSISVIKQEWKNEALLAIDIASKMRLRHLSKKSCQQPDVKNQLWVSKLTSILLAMAVDGFSTTEMCLHYVVSSSPDEIVLSSVICRLDTVEVLKLLQYLGKWLRKYTGYYVTGPSPSSVTPGIKACKWVPSLGLILQWVSLVLDEHHSTLVLCSEFHDEIKSLEKLVKSFKDSVSVSCSLASVVELLKSDACLPNINRFNTETDHFIEFLDIS